MLDPRTLRIIIFFAVSSAILTMFPKASHAHPIAQGHGVISCDTRGVDLILSVSEEQIAVWDTFRKDVRADVPILAAHEDYIKSHLYIETAGERLFPKSVSLNPDVARPSFHEYKIRFVRDADQDQPCHISIRQSFLREIEYAPGNPWEAIFSLTVAHGESSFDTVLLGSDSPLSITFGQKQSRFATFLTYSLHGVHHILTGYDHLLFVTALVLGVATLWRVFVIVSVFTLAHTITLVCAVFELVRLPSELVEPIITGSIIFVAATNVWCFKSSSKGLENLHAILPAFCFGLFHGLGFAGGLLDNLASGDTQTISVALLGFASGVELGHQVVIIPIVALLMIVGYFGRMTKHLSLELQIRRYISLVVIGLGMFYFGQSLGLLS